MRQGKCQSRGASGGRYFHKEEATRAAPTRRMPAFDRTLRGGSGPPCPRSACVFDRTCPGLQGFSFGGHRLFSLHRVFRMERLTLTYG